MATPITIDDEWKNFLSPDYDEIVEELESIDETLLEPPKATEIYISTKSKIAYLNQHIDLKDVFWKVPVIPYAQPSNGVIKKQMKFNSLVPEDLDIITQHLTK